MKLSLESGRIVAHATMGRIELTVQQIYTAVFESEITIDGERLDAESFQPLGLTFSDAVCLPVLLLNCHEAGTVSVQLAGKVGTEVAVAEQDYVIHNRSWFPLPVGSKEEARSALLALGLNFGIISFGQFLKLLRPGFSFPLVDLASSNLGAQDLAKFHTESPPRNLNAKLFPYQETGYKWLKFMADHELGAILADEMGLGKTLQVIGLILHESERGRCPNLVICPATIIENWRRELSKFAPTLSVLIHRGPRRAGLASAFSEFSVVITSYETATADIALLCDVSWNMVVIDEAQAVKNPSATRSVKLRRIKRRLCVAITGTPVENSLTDLWSICDFVSPGQLGTIKEFERNFPDSLDSAKQLEPVVSALMLRRRVAEVAQDLPERIEIPVPLELERPSALAYEEIRQEAAKINPGSPDFTSIVPLRVFCAHPWAANKLRDQSPEACSPKVQRLLELLEEIVATNEKVLIFTSFQSVSDLLQGLISSRFQLSCEIIDGRIPVPERQVVIDRFSACATSAVLILNPKAAGVGLNITAANHVIHYNLEWNPALEDQATARSYRRGQQRPVSIHRFYYINTIEEVVNERMQRKRELSEAAVVGTDGRDFELEDMRRALTISPL